MYVPNPEKGVLTLLKTVIFPSNFVKIKEMLPFSIPRKILPLNAADHRL